MGDAETTIRERIKEIRKKFKIYEEEPIKTVWSWVSMGKKSIMRMLLTLSISQICYMFIVVIMFGLGVFFFLGETEIIISPNVISQNVEIIKEKSLDNTLDEMDIPAYIEYAKLSNSGNYINRSIQDEELIQEVRKRKNQSITLYE